jgi:excisionase family DNA binding protein
MNPGSPTPPPLPGAAAPAQPAPAAPAIDILTPAQAAGLLGVTEADVIAAIDAGELKGRKIGSAYRIPRAAIDEFFAR